MLQPHKIMLSGMHSVRMLGRLHAAAGTAHGVRTWWGYKQRCPARDSGSLPACRCCGAAVHRGKLACSCSSVLLLVICPVKGETLYSSYRPTCKIMRPLALAHRRPIGVQVDAAETADAQLVVLHARQLQQLMPNASSQQIHVRPGSFTDHLDKMPCAMHPARAECAVQITDRVRCQPDSSLAVPAANCSGDEPQALPVIDWLLRLACNARLHRKHSSEPQSEIVGVTQG